MIDCAKTKYPKGERKIKCKLLMDKQKLPPVVISDEKLIKQVMQADLYFATKSLNVETLTLGVKVKNIF